MSGITDGGEFDVVLLTFPGAGQRERADRLLIQVQPPDNKQVKVSSLDGGAGVGGARCR